MTADDGARETAPRRRVRVYAGRALGKKEEQG